MCAYSGAVLKNAEEVKFHGTRPCKPGGSDGDPSATQIGRFPSTRVYYNTVDGKPYTHAIQGQGSFTNLGNLVAFGGVRMVIAAHDDVKHEYLLERPDLEPSARRVYRGDHLRMLGLGKTRPRPASHAARADAQ